MLTQETEGIAVTSEKAKCQQCRPVGIRKSKKCVTAEIMCWRKSGRRRKSGGGINQAFEGKQVCWRKSGDRRKSGDGNNQTFGGKQVIDGYTLTIRH